MTSAANRIPPTGPSSAVVDLVAGLSREEQVAILTGSQLFETTGVERVGIPRIRLLDGPAGVRGTEFLTTTSLSVPCGTALGATWNRALVELVGGVLGRQARAKGARVHLAPTLNLCRVAVGGRNFESFGEDPMHVACLGAAYVRGVQSEGVASCVKHFVGNDTEHERFTINSAIDERTLREVYLRPFEDAVLAGAGAIMAAYNSVNGTTVSENHRLLNEVLRDEWGFSGPVVSDWYGIRSTVEALVGGTDLEMPGPGAFRGAKLLAAIDEGLIDAEVVVTSAQRVVSLLEQFGGLADGGPGTEATRDDAADRAIVRRAATEAIVLLKNASVDGQPALRNRLPSSARTQPRGRSAAAAARWCVRRW
jgi:beta-glucosidase